MSLISGRAIYGTSSCSSLLLEAEALTGTRRGPCHVNEAKVEVVIDAETISRLQLRRGRWIGHNRYFCGESSHGDG